MSLKNWSDSDIIAFGLFLWRCGRPALHQIIPRTECVDVFPPMQRLKFNQIEIPKPLARDPEHWTRDPILNQMTRGFREVQKPDLIQSWIFLLRQLTVFTDRIYVGLSPLVIRSDSIRVWIKSVVWDVQVFWHWNRTIRSNWGYTDHMQLIEGPWRAILTQSFKAK
jgi:hypothetical protein